MLAMIKMILKNQKGQGMVEYGLILAAIAVVALAALTPMGTTLKGMLDTLTGKL